MRKGDMCLKILEDNQFKDVIIKEGEVFLLPGRIPHSQNRWAETVGLVIERERMMSETDGLRYSNTILNSSYVLEYRPVQANQFGNI